MNEARIKFNKSIDLLFKFLEDDYNEISSNLGDILIGKKLYIKKWLKPRKILGVKIDSNDDLDYYLYPEPDLSYTKKKSTNIMIIGEIGVGKSACIHSLLNHLEKIDIDENIRYLLFNEKRCK